MLALVGLSHAALGALLWHRARPAPASDHHRAEAHGGTSSRDDDRCHEVIEQLLHCVPDLRARPLPPPPLRSTPLRRVGTEAELRAAVAELAGCPRLAVDTEHHSVHSYAGVTCLVQLSTGQVDYLIDAFALRGSMALLAGVLSDPRCLKVLHGGVSDAGWLHRDFGLRVINIFDTEKACHVLGLEHCSLASLLARYCGVHTDKRHQMSDWRQRPLPLELEEYARSDVHWLLYIADCLGQELLQAAGTGRGRVAGPVRQECEVDSEGSGGASDAEDSASEGEAGGAACQLGRAVPVSGLELPLQLEVSSPLGRVVQRSQGLCLTRHTPPLAGVAVSASAVGLMRGTIADMRESQALVGPWSGQEVRQLEVLGDCVHALCVWRDAEAQRLDDGLQCVLPDNTLLHLATTAPGTEQEVRAALEDAPPPRRAACHFPASLVAAAAQVAAILADAVAGQRPWVHPDVQELIRSQGSAAATSRRRVQDPAAFKQSLGQRFATKKTVYENCQMLSQDGDLLCYCDRKRLEWYVSKGLAEETCPEPFTVRLTFPHRDGDQRGGTAGFYSTARSNVCVVCGEGTHYLRWRVVPACYRKALPMALKSHRSHDVLLLCVTCHEQAQAASERLKRSLSTEYNIPLFRPLPRGEQPGDEWSEAQRSERPDLHPYNVRRAALALHHSDHKMPAERRAELAAQVREYVQRCEPGLPQGWPHGGGEECTSSSCCEEVSERELWAGLLAGLGPQTRRRTLRRWLTKGFNLPSALLAEAHAAEVVAQSGGTVPGGGGPEVGGGGAHLGAADLRGALGHQWHGQQVVAAALARGGLTELVELCSRFRRSFVDTLRPLHLPHGWAVDHAAPREFGDFSVYAAREAPASLPA